MIYGCPLRPCNRVPLRTLSDAELLDALEDVITFIKLAPSIESRAEFERGARALEQDLHAIKREVWRRILQRERASA